MDYKVMVMKIITYIYVLISFVLIISCGPDLNNPIEDIHKVKNVNNLEIIVSNGDIIERKSDDGSGNIVIHISHGDSVELAFRSQTAPNMTFMDELVDEDETWAGKMKWTWTFWQASVGCKNKMDWKESRTDKNNEIKQVFSCKGENPVDNGCWRVDVRAENPEQEEDTIELASNFIVSESSNPYVKGVGLQIVCQPEEE
jgi:hypothetical protein